MCRLNSSETGGQQNIFYIFYTTRGPEPKLVWWCRHNLGGTSVKYRHPVWHHRGPMSKPCLKLGASKQNEGSDVLLCITSNIVCWQSERFLFLKTRKWSGLKSLKTVGPRLVLGILRWSALVETCPLHSHQPAPPHPPHPPAPCTRALWRGGGNTPAKVVFLQQNTSLYPCNPGDKSSLLAAALRTAPQVRLLRLDSSNERVAAPSLSPRG